MFTDVYRCFTDVLLMFYWCLPDGSQGIQCCQPSKSCKNWWKYQKNSKKMGWQHCICLGITRFLGIIGSHRWHRLTIGYYRWHRWCTRYIFGHRRQNQHRLPEDIGNQKKRPESSRIVIGFGRSRSVPGLLSAPFRFVVKMITPIRPIKLK